MGDAVCYLPFLDEEGRMPEPRVTLRRAYDPPPRRPVQITRVLVDRTWPPGVRKRDLAVDVWVRDLAPSVSLRRWFDHRPERWDQFRRRYREELRDTERARLLDELAAIAGREPIILLFAARDRTHNQAVLIAEAIEERLAGGQAPVPPSPARSSARRGSPHDLASSVPIQDPTKDSLKGHTADIKKAKESRAGRRRSVF